MRAPAAAAGLAIALAAAAPTPTLAQADETQYVTVRDRLMCRLALEHPGYGFESHMGYAVPQHLEALRRLGPTVHHRKMFAPVAALLQAELPLTVLAEAS